MGWKKHDVFTILAEPINKITWFLTQTLLHSSPHPWKQHLRPNRSSFFLQVLKENTWSQLQPCKPTAHLSPSRVQHEQEMVCSCKPLSYQWCYHTKPSQIFQIITNNKSQLEYATSSTTFSLIFKELHCIIIKCFLIFIQNIFHYFSA